MRPVCAISPTHGPGCCACPGISPAAAPPRRRRPHSLVILYLVAASVGLSEDQLDLYGRNKAKVHLDVLDSRRGQPDGNYVVVTGINPTPLGEGKSTVTIGLCQVRPAVPPLACMCASVCVCVWGASVAPAPCPQMAAIGCVPCVLGCRLWAPTSTRTRSRRCGSHHRGQHLA